MWRRFLGLFALYFAFAASSALASVSADFTTGAIAEYSSNNANQNSNSQGFSTLGISKIVMSQAGSTWGGTQGNDLSVTLTIHFTDNSTYSFSNAVLNWQKNASGGGVTYFGITTSSVVPDADDRYTRSNSSLKKTYILVLPSQVASSNFSSLISSDDTDGSANFSPGDVFSALQGDFPTNAAPSFTNQNAGGGTSYSFDYAENSATSTVLGTVSASDPEGDTLSFSITGGNASGYYTINASSGAITLTPTGAASLANDYEQAPNSQTITVTVSDGTNTATVQVALNETNLDDIPPAINGPGGVPGAAASAISVNENQTGVTTLSADKTVTWSIVGGQDGAKFALNPTSGVLTFIGAPNFEAPTDGSIAGSNTYVVQVQARDGAGNVSLQTITVTVLNLDDSAPLITGPSGGEGAAVSAISINEGLTAVTTFTANETVTWSIDGGSEAAKFSIDPVTGAIVFLTAPDFENPTDSDHNNTYVVRIKATDSAGNVSYQTLTVTVPDLDEIGRKITQIGSRLRSGLRSYAVHGLSDMLSFNESLMSGGGKDDICQDPTAAKDLSGSVRANEDGANINLNYARRLSECGRRNQIYIDAGLAFSRLDGNASRRLFTSVRFETRINPDLTLGVGAIASNASGKIGGFDTSTISDMSLQLNLYGRYRITEKLRTGAFVGVGRSWYDFGLSESDGFVLDGRMSGNRLVYGWMLSGDYSIGNTVITTDAVVSHAREHLGSASLDAQYLGEHRSDMAFEVGTVDVTRISVPVTAPITLSGNKGGLGSWSRLLLSPGLLCEDTDADTSSLHCGYQFGAKLVANNASGRSRFYADYHWESMGGIRRSLIGLGYAYRFGKDLGFELALDLDSGLDGGHHQDNRALLSLRLAN